MLSVLVVDDERRTHEFLVAHLPWRSIGIDTVYQAQDGVETIKISY